MSQWLVEQYRASHVRGPFAVWVVTEGSQASRGIDKSLMGFADLP